ncbi:MAG: hypothetical protein P8078_12740 [bacterium]
MKKLYCIFILMVICAPLVFYLYLQHDLVCEVRAVISSALFGLVPLLFLSLGIIKKRILWYCLALDVLIMEMIITPVIMLNRLGWEKFYPERLLAFFTFEGVAAIEIILVIFMLKKLKQLKQLNSAVKSKHS